MPFHTVPNATRSHRACLSSLRPASPSLAYPCLAPPAVLALPEPRLAATDLTAPARPQHSISDHTRSCPNKPRLPDHIMPRRTLPDATSLHPTTTCFASPERACLPCPCLIRPHLATRARSNPTKPDQNRSHQCLPILPEPITPNPISPGSRLTVPAKPLPAIPCLIATCRSRTSQSCPSMPSRGRAMPVDQFPISRYRATTSETSDAAFMPLDRVFVLRSRSPSAYSRTSPSGQESAHQAHR